MIASIVPSVIAYISTNIDDIFVVMILLAQAERRGRGKLIAGHFLGVGMVTAISMLGAFGLRDLPLKYVGILGLAPIALGIRAWVQHRKEAEDRPESDSSGFFSMALITLGNGADNIGVYIPLFTGFAGTERIAAAVVFAVMTGVWVFLANALAEFPRVKAAVGKYKHIVIPVVLIALGVYIILDSGLLG